MREYVEEEKKEMTDQEMAMIEMMKKKNDEIVNGQHEKKHQFWNTQPMPQKGQTALPEGPINPNTDPSEIRETPYTLPPGFEWSNIDLSDEATLTELYKLLKGNYVEGGEFRFAYSPEFLVWALTPPHYNPDYIFGVRATKNKKLFACITGIPTRTKIYNTELETIEINYLCVHKKLREKRLAPVLIKEVTRRANRNGIFQAVYTAAKSLPGSIGMCRYSHRFLNPVRLVELGFIPSNKFTTARMLKEYKLPKATRTPGLRPMEEKDVDQVHILLNKYLDRFQLRCLFTREEIAHFMLPRENVIYSYVAENKDGEVTDFSSFFLIPSSVVSKNETLYIAYSYYNVAQSVMQEDLMRDSLVLAKATGADMFNALNLMENKKFFTDLKFHPGQGDLHYYLFNYTCPDLTPEMIGFVLV